MDAVLTHLLPEGRQVARAIDGTLGAGGHSRALLEHGVGELLALDLDPQAIALASANLAPFADRVHIVHASYPDLVGEAARLGWDAVDCILLDLGVSSMQLDTAERGFAFRYDAPLDMRFDPSSDRPTAADLLNTWQADDLADIFFRYGEERESRRLARIIVRHRETAPFVTTRELADLIAAATPAKVRRETHIHPATRVFQALRIAVNDELTTVERVIPLAIDRLRSGGRLGIISFHSLEDRIVKDAFKAAATDCICPPQIPICVCGHVGSVDLITRKPIIADETEAARNPRSRSAKFRVVEKR